VLLAIATPGALLMPLPLLRRQRHAFAERRFSDASYADMPLSPRHAARQFYAAAASADTRRRQLAGHYGCYAILPPAITP